MKLIAKYNVQVRGHIYCKGEAMEWPGPLTPRIIANFTAADGRELALPQPPPKDGEQEAPPPNGELPLNPQPKDGEQEAPPQGESQPPPKDGDVDEDELINHTLEVLKREGVMRQLDELGVTYPGNAKSTFLARLLLMSKGEIKAE